MSGLSAKVMVTNSNRGGITMAGTATDTAVPTPIFDMLAAQFGIDWDAETAATAAAAEGQLPDEPEREDVQLAS
jgi:hypothetical protein